MQNIDQCIKPALLIVNFFYINVKIDLTFLIPVITHRRRYRR